MKVMILDGQYQHSLPIAAELRKDLNAEVIAVGPSRTSHLLRSRYVSKTLLAPLSTEPNFVDRILEFVEDEQPDVLVPIGYYSFRNLIAARSRLPASTKLLAPEARAFAVAENKSETYALADRVGVNRPQDLTHDFESRGADALPYPVFLKARFERGGDSTALIRDSSALKSFDLQSIGGDVLVQEFIDADPFTYAHSGYFLDGNPVLTRQHQELRSVPRRGGSATRVRTHSDLELARQANALLRELSWTGVAQVEFKRRSDGTLVLMEINPKFWASYALVSRAGARIAAAAVSSTALRPLSDLPTRRNRDLEMVFPLREALYALEHRREESLIDAARHMLWPPAAWDIDITDLYANFPMRSSRAVRSRNSGAH